MKKLLAIGLAACMVATASFAQEKSGEPVTQAQLAEVLVRALGLVSSLPNPASDQQRFTVLMQNGICPQDGWTAGQAVTKKDLAVVLVQALGAEDEVENPEDPASWLAVLQENGIDMDQLTDPQTVMDMEALPVVVAENYSLSSVDPLVSEQSPSRSTSVYNTSLETVGPAAPASVLPTIQAVQAAVSTVTPKPRPKPTPH